MDRQPGYHDVDCRGHFYSDIFFVRGDPARVHGRHI